jgi:hypothetical protein
MNRPSPETPALPRTGGEPRGKRGRAGPGLSRVLTSLGLVIGIVLASLGSASTVTPLLGSGSPAARPNLGGYTWSEGNLSLSLPSLGPGVNISNISNRSLSIDLDLVHIFEVVRVPGVGIPRGPLGLVALAVAEPLNGVLYELSATGNLSSAEGVTVVLSGTLPVRALGGGHQEGVGIWSGPGGQLPVGSVGAVLGEAHLNVSIHIEVQGTSPVQGVVRLGLNITDWPWVVPGDGLALEWEVLGPNSSSSLESCAGFTTGASPDCPGASSLSPSSVSWANSTGKLVPEAAGRPLASVSWEEDANVTAATGSPPSPVALGTAIYYAGPGVLIRLLQEVSGLSPSVTSFSLDPVVALNLWPLPLPTYLRANLPLFVGGALVGGLVLVGVVIGIRHRESRKLRNL